MNSKNYFLRLVLLLFVLQIKTAYSQEIWDLVWTNTVTEVSGGSTYTVDISPNQSKVVSGSNNSYLIKIWDAETGNLAWSINTGYGQILKTIFSPDGNTLLIGSNSGIALRNTDYGQLIWSTSAGLIRDVNFSPDGNNVVSAGLDKTIKVWNAQNGNLIWTGIHDSTLKKAVYSPDNTKIASCSNDGVIKIWDAQSGTEIWQGHHSSYIWDVAFSPDGSMVASSGNEDGVKVWDANNGSLLWAGVISGQVESLDFSSDGSRITAISSNGLGDNLFVWNSNTGEVVWSKDTNSGLRDVDYSPDGKKIVTGNALTYTYKVQIWDASDGELLFNGDHSNVVDDVKFSSDSKTVVSASWDNTVKLWKFTKELELSSLKEKEVLKGGTVKELTWTNKNINAINIEFSSDSGQTWTTVIDNLVANTGLYNWLVPQINSENCKIRIVDTSDSTLFAECENEFEIFKGITVLTPNGGESLPAGGEYIITWSSRDIDSAKIEYTSDNSVNWSLIASNVSSSDSTFTWVVPSEISSQYKVRISQEDLSTVFDISDNSFEVYNALDLTAPNGGEILKAGSIYNIMWNEIDLDYITIELSRDNGTTRITMIDSIDASVGSYEWALPGGETTQGKIKISDIKYPGINDISENTFSIVEPKLSLTSPKGGEAWIKGEPYTITWTSSYVDKINIEFTLDNDLNWSSINDSFDASIGSYEWTVPEEQTDSAKIKISNLEFLYINDISGDVFSIVELELDLTSPKGGEAWIIGDEHAITWTSKYIDKIKIEFTSDNGKS